MKTLFIILSFVSIIIVVIFYLLGYLDDLNRINLFLIGFLTTILFWVLIYLTSSNENNNLK